MLLDLLVQTSAALTSTAGRSAKVERLAALLRTLAAPEIEPAVSWLAGAIRQGRPGIGPATVRELWPAGAAARPTVTLVELDAALAGLATSRGAGVGRERLTRLAELLARATRPEQEFVARLLLGELRQGALAGVMAEALARAAQVPPAEVRRALLLAGDLPTVAVAVLTAGRGGLARFRLELLRPLQPMLAQPGGEPEQALARLGGAAALEFKLDGARIQLHRADDEVRIFSRRLNDVTAALPELVELARTLPVRRFLLDGEVLALRPDGTPHPFQVTMRRFGRRLDVARLRAELPLTPWFFDLLHREGEDLVDRPAAERFAALGELVPAWVVPRRVVETAVEARGFFDEALDQGHEGLMAKALDAPYEAGARGRSWLKVKPAHTLDLVVLAAEWGSGRRQGWLSNLHLGARDPRSGGWVMLGKTFKGLTDAMLVWQTARLRQLAEPEASDAWVVPVRPELVVEVAFAEVQASPRYPAGLALRFARVKRYREDKTAAEADTIDTVRAIHAGRG